MYSHCHSGTRERGTNKRFQGYGGPVWQRRPRYNVPVNIAEKENEFEVTIYATGFDKENIKLTVVDDELFISGTRTMAENEPTQFVRQEFPVRSFERVISLGNQVDKSAITARQEKGILYITLPKTPEATKPEQEISIS